MKKYSITTLLFFILLFSGCVDVSRNQNVNVDSNSQNSTTTDEVNTSDWRTYRNEEYGFEFKYPADWNIDIRDEGKAISIFSIDWRDGLPEGGAEISIEVTSATIDEFINDYNDSDKFSKIYSRERYIISNLAATKLIGTTAIGIDSSFIFISKKNNNFVIFFHDFDEYHLKILSTLEFI